MKQHYTSATLIIDYEQRLEKLLDRIQHTKKDQDSSDELTMKMDNYKFAKQLMNKYQNNRRITRDDMIACNEIWKKYENSNIDLSNINWVNIDEFINNGNKIGAIKLYRNRYKCSLREAKNAVDRRHDDLREKNIMWTSPSASR